MRDYPQYPRLYISAVRITNDYKAQAEHDKEGEEDGEEAEDAAALLVPGGLEESPPSEICCSRICFYPVLEERVVTLTGKDRSQVI